jgi:transcriptional regulator
LHPESHVSGERHYRYKLSANAVRLVFDLKQKGWLQREIAAKVGCGQAYVSRLLRRACNRSAIDLGA